MKTSTLFRFLPYAAVLITSAVLLSTTQVNALTAVLTIAATVAVLRLLWYLVTPTPQGEGGDGGGGDDEQ